jgi:hypothetical protein
MTTFVEVIHYSFYIFEHNFLEFEKVIDSYTEEIYSQGIRGFDLRNRDFQAQRFEEVKKEIARLLHNYLAARFSLKEQTHAEEKSLTNPSLVSAIKAKKGELFKDNHESAFLQDLRNYIQHRSLPLLKKQSSISFTFGQPDFDINHSLYLDTNKLLEWNKWTSPAKRHLSNHAQQISIQETIKSDFFRTQSFYQWLICKLSEATAKPNK